MADIQKPWWTKDTIAVVTGANRGIGYETVRLLAEKGLTVVLTARDPEKGQAALDSLKAQGLESIVFHQLDISSPESVETLAAWLKTQFGGIDILINNAALLDKTFCYKTAKAIFDSNYNGVKNVTEGLLPLMRASPAGARIVNVTARLGLFERFAGEELKEKFRDESNHTVEFADAMAAKYLEDVKAGLGEDDKNWPWIPFVHQLGSDAKMSMYGTSKVCMNVYTKSIAKHLAKKQPEDHQIFVAAYCPGPTETGMLNIARENFNVEPAGFAIKNAAEGADTGVWLALLPKKELPEKVGKLFGERAEYPFDYKVDF